MSITMRNFSILGHNSKHHFLYFQNFLSNFSLLVSGTFHTNCSKMSFFSCELFHKFHIFWIFFQHSQKFQYSTKNIAFYFSSWIKAIMFNQPNKISRFGNYGIANNQTVHPNYNYIFSSSFITRKFSIFLKILLTFGRSNYSILTIFRSVSPRNFHRKSGNDFFVETTIENFHIFAHC